MFFLFKYLEINIQKYTQYAGTSESTGFVVRIKQNSGPLLPQTLGRHYVSQLFVSSFLLFQAFFNNTLVFNTVQKKISGAFAGNYSVAKS